MALSGFKFVLREGFWASVETSLPPLELLPVVITSETPWEGKQAFLKCLDVVENLAGLPDTGLRVTVELMMFKGWSTCRGCGRPNGSTEFVAHSFGLEWHWPVGFRHYVEEHNVRPSLAFQDYILGATAFINGWTNNKPLS